MAETKSSDKEKSEVKSWCEENLSRDCILDDYPDYRHICVAQKGEPCEFGQVLSTIERLPLEVRLKVLRKLSEMQKERLESEFES